MQTIRIDTTRNGFGTTERTDSWWIAPILTAAGLILFFGYLTLRAFNPTYVWAEPYISPAVAPPIFTPARGYPGAVPVEHAWFGVMLINAALLSGYTFGCHSWRHLIGGRYDCLTCSSARYGMWKGSSRLNEQHMLFAWLSLVWVCLTDAYVYLVALELSST